MDSNELICDPPNEHCDPTPETDRSKRLSHGTPARHVCDTELGHIRRAGTLPSEGYLLDNAKEHAAILPPKRRQGTAADVPSLPNSKYRRAGKAYKNQRLSTWDKSLNSISTSRTEYTIAYYRHHYMIFSVIITLISSYPSKITCNLDSEACSVKLCT